MTDYSELETNASLSGGNIDPKLYAACLQTVEQLMSTVQHLDWQLTTTKHILKKYKDLAVAQQLHINASAVKLAAVKVARDELKVKCSELTEIVSQYSNKIVINKDIEKTIKSKR